MQQIANRRRELGDSWLASVDSAFEYNYKRGIISGLELALAIPQGMLEEAELAYAKELRNERGS